MNDPFLVAPLVAVPLGLLLVYLLIRYLRGSPGDAPAPAGPVPPDWWPIAVKYAPMLDRLHLTERDRLLRYMQSFIHGKYFEGCDGLEITDEMKVAVASQACLLILHLNGPCFPLVQSVLLYPGAFVAKRAGWVQEATPQNPTPLAGEAHGTGEVLLAWDQVREGGTDPADGRNVVYHEFAHQLDMEDRAADGVPVLEQPLTYRGWRRILGDSFDHLTRRLNDHLDAGALSEYAATNPAEFFAVATEVFFERPSSLAGEYPELFDLLVRYYRKDPRQWFEAAPDHAGGGLPTPAVLRDAFAPTPWGKLFLRSVFRWPVLAGFVLVGVLQVALHQGDRSLRGMWWADCRTRYAHARGHADSLKVDRRLEGAGSSLVTCQSLRFINSPSTSVSPGRTRS